MKLFKNSNTEPYFNMATEQYLLDNIDGEIFMLWINDPVVVIGKNQNAYAELDLDFVEKNKIKTVRRLTGGGAVFHDRGNVNFTFIIPQDENRVLDFKGFTQPIIDALTKLGATNVRLSGRNDIMIEDRKVSGNAQCVYNGKIMHHGTLLYDSDISQLVGALRVDEEKIKSKGIKSVKNRVGNIKDFINSDMTPTQFKEKIEEYVTQNGDFEICEFSDEQKKEIEKMSKEKYSTWEWNFGKSKEFTHENKLRFDFGSVGISVLCEGGLIVDFKITGDFFGVKNPETLSKEFIGKRFGKEAIKKVIEEKSIVISDYIAGMTTEDFLRLI